MAEVAREAARMAFRPPGLAQAEYLETEATVLEPIFCLEAGAEAEMHPRPVSREEWG